MLPLRSFLTHMITQSYDTIGRMVSIANSETTYLSGLSYNTAGETLGLTMGNGVLGSFTCNDHLQLQTLRYSKTGITPDPLNLAYDVFRVPRQVSLAI
ncbi:MAG: hypothetical protein LAO78_04720 [Acidobacteriia bacterium]|nr:hypothetical protein [Terriglobia bacterium]